MLTLRKHFVIAWLLICVTALSGCAVLAPTRVWIVNSQSDVLLIGGDCKGTVYTMADDGTNWVKRGRVKLPAGWYLTPGPNLNRLPP